jgi:hypothetical protein
MPRSKLPLTEVPARLRDAGYTMGHDYRWLLNQAQSARLPGAERIDRVWHVDDDIPAIAETIGAELTTARRSAA